MASYEPSFIVRCQCIMIILVLSLLFDATSTSALTATFHRPFRIGCTGSWRRSSIGGNSFSLLDSMSRRPVARVTMNSYDNRLNQRIRKEHCGSTGGFRLNLQSWESEIGKNLATGNSTLLLARSPVFSSASTSMGVDENAIEQQQYEQQLVLVDSSDDALSCTQQEWKPTITEAVSNWVQEKIFLGIEPTPEILAIMTIYFVEGALGLAKLAQTYLLKDELSLGPVELSALTGLFVLPWTIKPLYGILSDTFPLFGYRRKSYLILAGIIGGLSYSVLGSSTLWAGLDSTTTVAGTVAAFMVCSASIAISDVVVDGIVVTRTREATDPRIAGGLQSLCWGSAAVGGCLSAYFSGSLLEVLSVREVFTIASVLPFFAALVALVTQEQPVPKRDDEQRIVDSVQQQLGSLWQALRQPYIWRPALFLFLWRSTPTSDGAFFFFLTNDLHLGPEFLGRVRLVAEGATLFGVWVYNQFLRTKQIKDILFWSTVASFPLGMLPVLLITHTNRALGIPDQALIVGDDVVLTVLGEISFLPTLVLAARLCPPGLEAVLFATLMSINNGAGAIGTEVGAVLTKLFGVTENDFSNLVWLTIVCNLTSLYPLVFINWLDGVEDNSKDSLEKSQTTQD